MMMLIGQLAKQTGTPVHTIRYYQKFGLFKGKRNPVVPANKYTFYDAEVVDKIELIKEAKSIGFTLSEIKSIIDAWHGKKLSKKKKREILLRKMKSIEERISQLKEVKKLLIRGMQEVDEC